MKELYSVGELAKQMNVTVRTLQYYDKINLLKPSKFSEGGRRLYTSKDMIQLHQILSLKYLGFSLEDIQSKMLSLDSPREVLSLIKQQILTTKHKIDDLQKALLTMEKMTVEIEKNKEVDFHKYADIISLIRNNNENYWVINCFDDKMMDHIRNEFKDCPENGIEIYHTYERMVNLTISLQEQNIAPDSKQGLAMAKEWWDMVMDFTKGDLSLLKNLEQFNQNKDQWEPQMAKKQALIDDYMEQALQAYFKTIENGDSI